MKNKKMMVSILSATALIIPMANVVGVEAQSSDVYSWEKYETKENKTAQSYTVAGGAVLSSLNFDDVNKNVKDYNSLFDELITLDSLKEHNFTRENTVLYKGSFNQIFSSNGNGEEKPYVVSENAVLVDGFNSTFKFEEDFFGMVNFVRHVFYNTETDEFVAINGSTSSMGSSITYVFYPNKYDVTYSKGTLVDTVVAPVSSYQNGARNVDGFWYVLGDKVEIPTTANSTNAADKAKLNLEQGEFTLKTSDIDSFGKVKLTAEKQTVMTKFAQNFGVIDARGTQEGWNVTVSATPFTVKTFDGFVGTPHQLPVGSLALNNVTGIERLNHANTVDGLPTGLINGLTAIDTDNALNVLNAAKGEGLGEFQFNFGADALALTVDARTAKIDKVNYPDQHTPYESTVTWNLVSGPIN